MLTRLAMENDGVQGKFKMSAGVLYKKHLIATGVNSYKTHPLMLKPGYRDGQIHLHAEIDAIKNALKLIDQSQLSRSELYIVRVKKSIFNPKKWVYGLAKPCNGCSMTIASFGVGKVSWTENEQELINSY
jgi:tRNA(Arg) A34 adenosine deaminase TadA